MTIGAEPAAATAGPPARELSHAGVEIGGAASPYGHGAARTRAGHRCHGVPAHPAAAARLRCRGRRRHPARPGCLRLPPGERRRPRGGGRDPGAHPRGARPAGRARRPRGHGARLLLWPRWATAEDGGLLPHADRRRVGLARAARHDGDLEPRARREARGDRRRSVDGPARLLSRRRLAQARDMTNAAWVPDLADDALARLAAGRGRVVMAAARGDGLAYVMPGARHGLFTEHLI